MPQATMHDGSTIEVLVSGTGPALLLSVDPTPATGAKADELRQWGMDPALGQTFIKGLEDSFTVVAFDYLSHVTAHPKPDTLTPENVAADLLAIADAAQAPRFAYYGYSWLAVLGLQLAIRTDRLDALVMGGYPPMGGPYDAMLKVTAATYEQAKQPKSKEEPVVQQPGEDFDWDQAEVTMDEAQTRQFLTLYEALQNFDDKSVRLDCPRLCFAGSKDTIDYGEKWGNARVDIVGPLLTRRAEIEAAGWDVVVLEGLDHTAAMQPGNELPFLRPWLEKSLRGQ